MKNQKGNLLGIIVLLLGAIFVLLWFGVLGSEGSGNTSYLFLGAILLIGGAYLYSAQNSRKDNPDSNFEEVNIQETRTLKKHEVHKDDQTH